MGNNEAPVAKFNADEIVLTGANTNVTEKIAGKLVCSGAKLYFCNGSAWEIVTSA